MTSEYILDYFSKLPSDFLPGLLWACSAGLPWVLILRPSADLGSGQLSEEWEHSQLRCVHRQLTDSVFRPQGVDTIPVYCDLTSLGLLKGK